MLPSMTRAAGPTRWATMPPGVTSSISSVTYPVGAFQARSTSNGRARPGSERTYTTLAPMSPCAARCVASMTLAKTRSPIGTVRRIVEIEGARSGHAGEPEGRLLQLGHGRERGGRAPHPGQRGLLGALGHRVGEGPTQPVMLVGHLQPEQLLERLVARAALAEPPDGLIDLAERGEHAASDRLDHVVAVALGRRDERLHPRDAQALLALRGLPEQVADAFEPLRHRRGIRQVHRFQSLPQAGQGDLGVLHQVANEPEEMLPNPGAGEGGPVRHLLQGGPGPELHPGQLPLLLEAGQVRNDELQVPGRAGNREVVLAEDPLTQGAEHGSG